MSPLGSIISVNTADRGSGAERVAWDLFAGFRQRGLASRLVVGDKKTTDPDVYPFFQSPHFDYRPFAWPSYQAALAASKAEAVASGWDDFHFPFAGHLPALAGFPPDAILFHNLHGEFFDLRTLPDLSSRFPVFVLLHDCWMLTGHCAYPVGCSRWQTGCGSCPDLTLPPAIARDASAENWQRKAAIYRAARLHVAAPTQWLIDRAKRSMLAPAMVESRVIPCPIDTRTFRPADRGAVRRELGLPLDAHVLLFAAFQARTNPYKDYTTVEAAIERLARLFPHEKFLFIGLGQAAPTQRRENVELRCLPFQSNAVVARYLQAADIYVHAAKEENFGLITGEALACGTPVVATAVGGLPEVIAHEERGLLVSAGDVRAMAIALARLVQSPALRLRLGEQAARYARKHFALDVVVNSYLEWFDTVRRATLSARKIA